MSGLVAEVTAEDFDARVLGSDVPVVVDYWADWCGPCKMMAPVIEELAAENPDLRFAKVDTMAQPELAARYGILSLPTFQIFRGGELVGQIAGARPKHKFLAAVRKQLG